MNQPRGRYSTGLIILGTSSAKREASRRNAPSGLSLNVLPAVLSAAQADTGELIVTQLFTGFGARLANVGACRADNRVEARMAQHEIMRSVADLGAVQ